MLGDELAVEQGEVAGLEPCDQPGERNLGRVADAAEHAFAEESAAELYAIEPADKLALLADFDRVRMTRRVQRQHCPLELAVYPGLLARGAGGDHCSEIAVVSDLEAP